MQKGGLSRRLAGAQDDARVLLSRAVECCPQHVELWLALARLETYENARAVLNQARARGPPRTACARPHAATLTRARPGEGPGAADDPDGGGDLGDGREAGGGARQRGDGVQDHRARGEVARRERRRHQPRGARGCGVRTFENRSNSTSNSLPFPAPPRRLQAWLKDAEAAEKSEPPARATAAAIVRATVGIGVEDEDRKLTWMADAEEATKRGSFETARSRRRRSRA